MPIDHLSPKAPELTPAEIRSAQAEFISAVGRELKITGDDTQDVLKVLLSAHDRLIVTSYLTGPSVRFKKADGGLVNAAMAAEFIAAQVHERNALLAHGPDPVAIVSARLQSLGIDKAQADTRAAGCIAREADGRVVRIMVDGKRVGPLARDVHADSTPEEISAYKDHTYAVTQTTKRILQEVEWEKHNPRQLATASDRQATLYRAVAGEL